MAKLFHFTLTKLIIKLSSDTQYPVIKQVAYSILKFQPLIDPTKEEWDILWTDNAIPPEQLSHMKPFQKINHFPSMYSLSRKNHLARHLMRMRKKFPEEYSFFPVTWLLPAEFPDFSNEIKQKSKVFIIKPQASSQGRGIFLTNNSDIIDKNEHYVAQRYINNPYLIEGLKFDCRVYVLLTGCDPLRIYLYNEGLARFATEEYESPNEENLVNSCMHLTNYAINKKSKNFIFNEKEENDDIGHKRSLSSLFEVHY